MPLLPRNKQPRGRPSPAKKGDRHDRDQGTRRSTRIIEQDDELMDTDDIETSDVEDEEDDTDEDYDERNTSFLFKKPAIPPIKGKYRISNGAEGSGDKGRLTKKAIKAQKAQFARENQVVYKMDEMVQNTLLYMLLMQHKKGPVKRADIMKHCINSQTSDFPQVLRILGDKFNEVFGMKLIGLEEPNKHGLHQTYILVSNFNMSVSDSVVPRDQESDCKRSLLFLILTVIFMTNSPIEEDDIWKIVEEMRFMEFICRSKEGLHRYLKQEYVLTMYLQQQVQEQKESENPVFRYSWGMRSEKEFSRWQILKFVSRQFPGRKPSDYIIQYGIARETEAELIDADIAKALERNQNAEDDDNGMWGQDEGDTMEEADDLLSQPDIDGSAITPRHIQDTPPPDITIETNEMTELLGETVGVGDENALAEQIETMEISKSTGGGENEKTTSDDLPAPSYPEFLHFPINEDYACPPTPGTSLSCNSDMRVTRSSKPYIPYPTIYDEDDEDD